MAIYLCVFWYLILDKVDLVISKYVYLHNVVFEVFSENNYIKYVCTLKIRIFNQFIFKNAILFEIYKLFCIFTKQIRLEIKLNIIYIINNFNLRWTTFVFFVIKIVCFFFCQYLPSFNMSIMIHYFNLSNLKIWLICKVISFSTYHIGSLYFLWKSLPAFSSNAEGKCVF